MSHVTHRNESCHTYEYVGMAAHLTGRHAKTRLTHK